MISTLLMAAFIIMYLLVPQVRYTVRDAFINVSGQTQVQRGVNYDSITLGMSAPFSGSARELGRAMQIGIQLRINEVNDAGGIHGRIINLQALDDHYEPDQTAVNLDQLLDDNDGAFALIGNVGTPTTKAILPRVLDNKTILFGTFSGAGLLRENPPDTFVFNYRASYEQEVKTIIDYFVEVEQIDPKKIAVFYQDDSFGNDGLDSVITALREYNIYDRPLAASYPRNSTQVDKAVAELGDKQVDIEAILIIGTYHASGRFIQAMIDNGYSGKFANVSFVGSKALAEEFQEMGTQYSDGVIVSQVVPFYDSHSAGVLRYRESLEKYFPNETPDFVSLEGYIVGSIFVEALERAGRNLSTNSMIQALESIEGMDLGIGPLISFSPSRHQASNFVWLSRLNAKGEFEHIHYEL